MQSTSVFFVLFFGLVALIQSFQSSATDTITLNAILSSGETLVSAGKIFELGFFQAGDGGKTTFVGIWYYNVEPRTVVWVANRDSPLFQVPAGFLVISEDGNVRVLDLSGVSHFQTDVPGPASIAVRTLRLLDSGNLVLFDDDGSGTGKYLWQSFTIPTDTFLPGMVMNESLKLVSWMDPTNPAKGNFSFQEDEDKSKLLIIMKRSSIYWRSDHSDSVELPSLITCFLSNCTKNTARKQIPRNGSSVNNQSLDFDYSKSRLLMNSSGEIQFYSLENNAWSLLWSEPLDGCSVFRPCGKFGLCKNTQEREHTCECLSGFSPVSLDDWGRRVFSNGCKRDIPTCSGNSKPDQFLSLKSMNVEKSSRRMFSAANESLCKQACLEDCQSPCEAYYYKAVTFTRGNNTRNGEDNCWIWTSDLSNLQESLNNDTGHDVYIRLSDSAAESTSRDCEPCGKYIIPYPLSTDVDCGDPSYYSFSCNQSTGQLVFLAMNKTYQVISINSEDRTFDVQISNLQGADTDSCSTPSALQLNESLPFDVTDCHAKPSTLSDSRKGYEIAWRPPLEPICNSSLDCKDWPESNCSTKQDTAKRCFCNSDFQWDGKALKCISGPLRARAAKTTANPSFAVIIGTILAGVILLASSIGCFFYRRRKGGKMNEMILANLEKEDEDLVDEDGNIVDLPYFSLESIHEATQNFSDSNKLGQGGFGPVYKGVFPGGQEIAVKRLLSQSGQGMDEFRNEVITIAKLQHRNLVRLLGYCIKGPERLLLYEYMPNTSLDTFIFDQERCVLLDWSMRFDIILGIARGLLYLHQDSRLRIIHRDLKTSNILLDEHMIPKISDFGLARIFAGKEIEANTMRVVGTYGYMSPEYAQAGFYSVKSDVFSFGVIVLEIISGKRNTGFFSSEKALSLLGYAWRLWEEGNAINFVDGRISKALTDDVTIIKCINIGLLCVQDDPSDRPTMSNALHMLRTEVTTTLPKPKEPGFVPGKFAFSSMSTSTSSLQAETRSVNKMSMTLPEGR